LLAKGRGRAGNKITAIETGGGGASNKVSALKTGELTNQLRIFASEVPPVASGSNLESF
jgi:hypothetical protein